MLKLIRGYPAYVAFATATLTVAVGVNLIVFTIVDALWLKPLPFQNSDRLVTITTDDAGPGEPLAFVSLEPSTWRAFDAVAGQVISTGHDTGLRTRVAFSGVGRDLETIGVTPQYFALFGLKIRGRDFTAEDDRPGAEPVAIISDQTWSREFGRSPDVIGRLIAATPVPIRIIGVAPRDFEGARRGERVDIWIPSHLVPRLTRTPAVEGVSLMIYARLYAGQTLLDAARSLVRTAQDPRERRLMERVSVVRLKDIYGTPESRTIVIREAGPLRLVTGLAVLVLLGGCATVMALVLVHYERRRRELGVRMALGASRGRLISELSCELGGLAMAGSAGALLVAVWGLRTIPAITTPGHVDLSRLNLSIDWRVLSAAVGMTALALVGAAGLPIIRCTRARVATELVSSVAMTVSASSHRIRQMLLSLHVCATVVILVAAGLFVRSVADGFADAAGFDVHRTVFVTVQLLSPQRDVTSVDADLRSLAARTIQAKEAVQSVPGVEVMGEGVPPIGPQEVAALMPYVVETGAERRAILIGKMAGSPQLLRTLGIPILAGRALTATDATAIPRPAVVTASLAYRLWPSGEPLGRVISLAGRAGTYVVVGIARDFVFGSFGRPAAGVIVVAAEERFGIEPHFVVRAAHPDSVVDPIEKAVWKSLPDAPWLDVETGQSIIARDLGRQRLGAWFFSGFGLTTLLLGVGGVFGLVAYLAESRRREFGVRLALGATSRRLVGYGLSAAMIPVSVGVAAGLLVSAAMNRVFTSVLVGLSAVDPLTYGAVAMTMLGAAGLAGLSGAWRIRFTQPADALRAE